MDAENRAVLSLRRYIDAALAHDWDALADTLADSYRMEDRRTLLKNSYDKAGDLERSRATMDVGFDDVRVDVVELLGTDRALLRGRLAASETGFVVGTLLVVRVDGDDRLIEAFLFEDDDLDVAKAQLQSMDAREP